MTHTWVGQLEALIERRAGIRLSSSIVSRAGPLLETRAHAEGLDDVAAYLRRLDTAPGRAELQTLINVLTVGKTSFWRYPKMARTLVDRVLPALDAVLPRGAAIEIWSAGCATGEEPYTMAMTLAAAGWPLRRTVRILGTDINTEFVSRAREGRFRLRPFDHEGLPAAARQFLRPQGEEWTVAPEVKKLVTIEPFNLLEPPYPRAGSWRIIICANVLIYFAPQTVRTIIERFHEALCPDGILFLGGTESIQPYTSRYRVVRFDEQFAYAKGEWQGLLDPYALGRGPSSSGRAPVPAPPGRSVAPVADVLPAPPRAKSPADWTAAQTQSSPPSRARLRQDLREVDKLVAAYDRGAAIERLGQLSTVHPDEPEVCQRLAILLFEERRFEEALEAFAIAVSVDPLAPDLHFYQGWLHHRRFGNTAEARDAFRRALFLEPDFAFARYEMAMILHRAGEFDAAAREYARAESSAQNESVKERLLARAAITGDVFWNHTAVVVELSQRNRVLAVEHCEPLDSLG